MAFNSCAFFSPYLCQMGKVNSSGLEVVPLKSKLQEKTEPSQQLQDQILKQQEALSRASQTLKDTRKAAGNKVKRVNSLSHFLFFSLLTFSLTPPTLRKDFFEPLSFPVMLYPQDMSFRRI